MTVWRHGRCHTVTRSDLVLSRGTGASIRSVNPPRLVAGLAQGGEDAVDVVGAVGLHGDAERHGVRVDAAGLELVVVGAMTFARSCAKMVATLTSWPGVSGSSTSKFMMRPRAIMPFWMTAPMVTVSMLPPEMIGTTTCGPGAEANLRERRFRCSSAARTPRPRPPPPACASPA